MKSEGFQVRYFYKALLILVALVVFQSGVPLIGHADDLSKTFYQGVSLYEEGNYEEALTRFLSIAEDEGIRNGKLAYNIGNTYMQLGKIGHAVLWYERAETLITGDPDLQFNRNVALSKVKDKQAETENLVSSLIFFWKDGFSLSQLQWLAIGLGILFWTTLLLAIWRRKGALKSVAALSGALFFVVASTAIWDTLAANNMTRGVVLADTVSVRSGLSDTSTELFTLHAGSFVSIEDQRKGWVRIAFDADRLGWVRAEAVEGL